MAVVTLKRSGLAFSPVPANTVHACPVASAHARTHARSARRMSLPCSDTRMYNRTNESGPGAHQPQQGGVATGKTVPALADAEAHLMAACGSSQLCNVDACRAWQACYSSVLALCQPRVACAYPLTSHMRTLQSSPHTHLTVPVSAHALVTRYSRATDGKWENGSSWSAGPFALGLGLSVR